MKSKILFCKELSETHETVENMTLDSLWWMFEQITIKDKIHEAYQQDIDRIQKAANG